ncbi:hypothetical protein AK88_05291 [Plasmodium fragile]|uniref:Schizont-infected cell agglutination extracellular alpha domain-containing protein n=1 Tax=Plasmodium fragile TaxID=5857 RepID=A0A0D9QDP0_PLAFR|nr:uncharacterized protein AK88_05291 [Plasmodium fragile]KJP85069.1 hypothetical protein AK88_05291 [Plasmodium fragile]
MKIKDARTYWTELFREVDNIFTEFTTAVGQSIGAIAGFCGDIYNGPYDSLCNNRCADITKILLYMKGYDYKQGKWKKREFSEMTEEKFREYLECIVASEAMLRLYGRNKDHSDIITQVSEKLAGQEKVMNQFFERGICENRDWGKVIFQSKSMGTALQNRLEHLSNNWASTNVGRGYTASGKCGWQDTDATDADQEPKNEQKCNETEHVLPQEDELMKQIKQWVDTADTFEHVKKVLDDIRITGGSTARCDIENKIKAQVKAVKDKVHPRNTAAAKPAPAKRVPAKPVNTGAAPPKPVAAKPASPPSSGSGMTTTSSGGGTGKPGAPGENGTKAATGQNCDWSSILDEKRKQVYVLGKYGKEELERMKDVLHDFMDYMEDPYGTVDALGANCYNTGWNDIDQDDIYYKEQTVADVVRCRLLTRALWFANGDNTQHKNANGGSAHMSADEERLRCDVVNAFGYILHHKYCAHKTAWTRGIKYAWKTVKSMGDPGGIKGADRGPVIDARCTECGYDIKNPVVRVVNGHMAQLLIHEGNLMHKIGQLERTAHCAMQWKDYKSGPGRTDGNGNVDWKNIPEVTKTEKEIVQKTQAAIQEVTAKIDEEIEKKKSEQDKGKDTNTTRKNTHIRPIPLIRIRPHRAQYEWHD